MGGWVSVLPTRDGHYYSSKFYISAWDPIGHRFWLARTSSTTCVSSPYPAICQKDYSVTPCKRSVLRLQI